MQVQQTAPSLGMMWEQAPAGSILSMVFNDDWSPFPVHIPFEGVRRLPDEPVAKTEEREQKRKGDSCTGASWKLKKKRDTRGRVGLRMHRREES